MTDDPRPPEEPTIELAILDVRRDPRVDGYEGITIVTSRGDIQLRYYGAVHGEPDEARRARGAAVFVGGVGGGWDTPGQGRLYPDLCSDMAAAGVAALRVRYRHPTLLEEAALDVLTTLYFLASEGIEAAALCGHSFGGAVVAQAGAHTDMVRTVVLLSTQAYGVDAIADLPTGCSTLIIHGTADEILPDQCSRVAYELAHEPKRLTLYEGARHGLDEATDEIRAEVRAWIIERVAARAPG